MLNDPFPEHERWHEEHERQAWRALSDRYWRSFCRTALAAAGSLAITGLAVVTGTSLVAVGALGLLTGALAGRAAALYRVSSLAFWHAEGPQP